MRLMGLCAWILMLLYMANSNIMNETGPIGDSTSKVVGRHGHAIELRLFEDLKEKYESIASRKDIEEASKDCHDDEDDLLLRDSYAYIIILVSTLIMITVSMSMYCCGRDEHEENIEKLLRLIN